MNRLYRTCASLLTLILTSMPAPAFYRDLGPLPVSLRGVPLPPVPGLLDGDSPIVVNQTAAIALGKALFWDQNLGSDGQACASCHFHAGADGRVKNQLNPGQKGSNASSETFAAKLSGGAGGPNYTLQTADFPFLRFENGNTNFDDDVVGSAGTFGGGFTGTSQFSGANDNCSRAADSIFHVGAIGTRRVAARNAPTVINAVFNHRNFWDGRANNLFNGSTPWGPRDPDAGVWIKLNARTVVKQPLNLINSALASQAVEPPVLNDVEVGCAARSWPDIGRKLLLRQPLQYQQVHPQDSVLGGLAVSSGSSLANGLRTTYRTLITQAFNQQYWSYGAVGGFGSPASGGAPYNQMEANFAMFFGLAIQLYESTLVSDQSPFDLSPVDAHMRPTWSNIADPTLAASLKQGFDKFTVRRCNMCHTGPALTAAAVETITTLLTPTAGASFGPAASPIAYGPNALGPDGATIFTLTINIGTPATLGSSIVYNTPVGTGAAAVVGLTRHGNLVTRDFTVNPSLIGGLIPRLMDTGFVNTGVAPLSDDPGLGNTDAFGNALSYVEQYRQYLAGNTAAVKDPGVSSVRSCDFTTPLASSQQTTASTTVFGPTDGIEADAANTDCADPTTAYIPTVAAAQANLNGAKMDSVTTGAFKVPGLRNVELTGPYFHTGTFATLEQLVQGDSGAFYQHDTLNTTGTHFDLTDTSDDLLPGTAADLVNFLKALTDDRVRYQQAPFDHPQLTVVHGHTGNEQQVTGGNALGANLGKDSYLVIPAVGANGAATPLLPFLQGLP